MWKREKMPRGRGRHAKKAFPPAATVDSLIDMTNQLITLTLESDSESDSCRTLARAISTLNWIGPAIALQAHHSPDWHAPQAETREEDLYHAEEGPTEQLLSLGVWREAITDVFPFKTGTYDHYLRHGIAEAVSEGAPVEYYSLLERTFYVPPRTPGLELLSASQNSPIKIQAKIAGTILGFCTLFTFHSIIVSKWFRDATVTTKMQEERLEAMRLFGRLLRKELEEDGISPRTIDAYEAYTGHAIESASKNMPTIADFEIRAE